jgi:ABC-type nitrate/sulfonate/bicarbonate transport system permease component
VILSFGLPTPWKVASFIGHWFRYGTGVSGTIWVNIGATLEVVLIGFVLGMVIGTLIGILSGTIPAFKYFINPFLSFYNSIPPLVMLPIFIEWLGFGNAPQIIIVTLLNVFLVAAVVQSAVEDIQGLFTNHARALGANSWQLLRSVYLPGIGIWLASLARQCFGHALAAACVSEFFGAKEGLGFLINYGQVAFNIREIYAAVIITAAIGVLFDVALSWVDHRANRYLVR